MLYYSTKKVDYILNFLTSIKDCWIKED